MFFSASASFQDDFPDISSRSPSPFDKEREEIRRMSEERSEKVSSGLVAAVTGVPRSDLSQVKVEGPGLGVIRQNRSNYFDIVPLHYDRNELKLMILSEFHPKNLI